MNNLPKTLSNDSVARSVLKEALSEDERPQPMLLAYKKGGHWSQSEWEDLTNQSKLALNKNLIPTIRTIRRGDHIVHVIPSSIDVAHITKALKNFDHEIAVDQSGTYVKVRS